MTEREAYIVLNMMEDIGPVRVRALMDVLGSAAAIHEAGLEDLIRANGVGRELARRILEQREEKNPAEELARAEKLGARVITPLDEDYPEPLKTIHDPPLALYVWGTLEPKDRHAIALVGTRRCSHYGKMVADRLAYQLAQTGFAVISGLARGIDWAAHEGALKGGGRTVAVLGSALDRMYPPESQALAERIADQGAVISEFPLGTAPGRTTFPMRNRIVSGLSMGVVVVEAAHKSGALITAHEALEQGRAVFAVPGRIDSQASRGPHQLIKTGARIVEDVDDILQEFEYLFPSERSRVDALKPRPEVQLGGEEQAVVQALWEGPVNVDALSRASSLSSARLSSLLLALEMKRVVRMLPGRMVELIVEWKKGQNV